MPSIDLKIGHVKIKYTYTYEDFFKNRLFEYEDLSDDPIDYEVKIELLSPIKWVNHVYQKHIGCRHYLYEDAIDRYTITKEPNSKVITQQVIFDKANHIVLIQLDPSHMTDLPTQEYVLSGVVFLDILMRYGYIALHASAISYQDDALLFSGPSQTGKSTHASYWQALFNKRVTFINDDKPLIYNENGQYVVIGSPFAGKDNRHQNIKKPLKSIIFLSQGKDNAIHEISEKEALLALLNNTYRPNDPALYDHLLKTIEDLMKVIPIYHLSALKDISAAEAIHQLLYKEAHHED
ncbi:MAG: hypothetical protein ACNA7K_06445 [Acholeplasmataceae bacterium]